MRITRSACVAGKYMVITPESVECGIFDVEVDKSGRALETAPD